VWACKKCRESVEDTFEVCWNCGTSKDGVEDPSFRPEVDVRAVAEAAGAEQPAHRPSAALPSNPPASSPAADHVIARGLIWVFRALALIGGIWGLLNIVHAVEASRGPRDVVLFAAVITAAAVVAFPLGMAEVIRLCLLVEANTRVARQTPSREQEKRGRR
jgi:hypothetical protein